MQTKCCNRMLIRQMNVEDVDGVAEIEADSFSPWNRGQIVSELKRKTGIALVAVTSDGVVQGWCCGLLAGSEADLLKVAVSFVWQRQGIATALLGELSHLLIIQGAEQLFLEVRSRNIPARELYVKQGFQETGIRRNYYKEPGDDAVIWAKKLKKEERVKG